MTAYGSRYYNTFTYGATPVTSLSVDPFIAYPSDYGTIKLEWTPPTGGDSLVLIRNASGFATTPDDGDLITSNLSTGSWVDTGSYIDPITGVSTISYVATTINKQVINEVKITVTDATNIRVGQLVVSSTYFTGVQGNTLVTAVTGNVITLNKPITIPGGTALTFSTRSLAPGKTYYYSIFAYISASAAWVRLGNALAVSVKDYSTSQLMYKYLPEAYTFPADSAVSQNTDLFNFLRIFAFEYDLFKTMAESATYRYDVDDLDARLIPALLDEFGFNYESSMGIKQARKLLKYAADIYLTKGSVAGIKKFIAAFSGYSVEIGTLKNLFLTLDCSSFETDNGFWNKTVDANNTVAIATVDGSIVPYIEAGSPANYPNARAGMLKHTSTTGGTYAVKYGYSNDATPALNPVLYGIPVTAGIAYTFSIYSWAKTTLRSITLAINWYDKNGILLSTGSTSSANNSTSAWTRITNANITAPAKAVYAVPQFTINSTANGEIHYFDAAQFHAGASAITYADSRRIDLYLQANRINQVLNPSFESATTSWSTTGTSAFATDASGAVTGSSNSGKLTANATSSTLTQASVKVTAGSAHTLSAYVKGTVGKTVTLSVAWKDSGGTTLSTSTSAAITLSATFNRISLTGTAPATAVTATITFTFAGVSGNLYYVDAILFEANSYADSYFDGSTGYRNTDDVLWENGGTNANSRSLYYRNKVSAISRLPVVIPEYLPVWSNWALYTGVPTS
jgi:hypothetical protein